jgi:hypothetical protein
MHIADRPPVAHPARRLDVLDAVGAQLEAMLPGEKYVIVAAPCAHQGVEGGWTTNCDTRADVGIMLRSLVNNLERTNANS